MPNLFQVFFVYLKFLPVRTSDSLVFTSPIFSMTSGLAEKASMLAGTDEQIKRTT